MVSPERKQWHCFLHVLLRVLAVLLVHGCYYVQLASCSIPFFVALFWAWARFVLDQLSLYRFVISTFGLASAAFTPPCNMADSHCPAARSNSSLYVQVLRAASARLQTVLLTYECYACACFIFEQFSSRIDVLCRIDSRTSVALGSLRIRSFLLPDVASAPASYSSSCPYTQELDFGLASAASCSSRV